MEATTIAKTVLKEATFHGNAPLICCVLKTVLGANSLVAALPEWATRALR
jgi:hypothetical protein